MEKVRFDFSSSEVFYYCLIMNCGTYSLFDLNLKYSTGGSKNLEELPLVITLVELRSVVVLFLELKSDSVSSYS